MVCRKYVDSVVKQSSQGEGQSFIPIGAFVTYNLYLFNYSSRSIVYREAGLI